MDVVFTQYLDSCAIGLDGVTPLDSIPIHPDLVQSHRLCKALT
jgi:hypothetical protein